MHLPRFWKHKETKEVIDHATYSDLKGKPESSNFEECDVTGNLLNTGAPVEVPEVPVGKTIDDNELLKAASSISMACLSTNPVETTTEVPPVDNENNGENVENAN